MTITRKEFAAILGKEAYFSEKRSADFVDLVFEIMAEQRGEKIKISGFGNLTVRKKRARTGRNPQTGERMGISARRVVTFKPSHLLRKAMGEAPREAGIEG
jgi:integration host factor subunit alpha